MRIAISNLAWDPPEDEAVASLLRRRGIDAIDVVPTKYLPVPAQATSADIAAVKATWAGRGIEITGMQSLLFGTTGFNVFGAAEVQDAMLRHLDDICRIGGGLGAPRLVFGSPKNRDRSGLTDEQAMETARSFFRRLGEVAARHGVIICLEPNPPKYACNFMTATLDTAAVVDYVGHPAIRMQFDAGALTINAENPAEVIFKCAPLVGHIHASEPDLAPLGDCGSDHARIAAALRQALPRHVVSIEMIATKTEPHLASIERAVDVVQRFYGDSPAPVQ